MPRISDEDARDLDETRRLLYMALLVPRTKKYNLAATLVNAIKYHQKVDVDADELMDRVVGYIEGTDADSSWLVGQIRRCIAALDEG
jgi:hypothetical protein